MNEKEPLSLSKKVYAISVFLYAGSMFLPAAEGSPGSMMSGTLFGIAAYILSYLSFLCIAEEGGLLLVLGCMSNIVILIIGLNGLKNRWLESQKGIIPPNNKPSLLHAFAILVTICSVSTWYFEESLVALYIGYYIWAMASVGIVGSSYVIKLQKSQEGIEDASH